MQSGNLWRVLGLCLLLVGAWAQDSEEIDDTEQKHDTEQKPYEVSISGNTVELTCPIEFENGIRWKKNDQQMQNENGKELLLDNFSEMDNSGYYQCFTTEGNTEVAHTLYLKARVCKNCMEVNLMEVATIIVVDICVTLGLLLLVYYWSKSRKAKATPMTRGAGAGGRPRGQNRERPPPVPNPDYEPIRKGQRDLYAGLNQRGV